MTTAINNYCTLQMIKPGQQKRGLIFIPEKEDTTSRWGEVLTVGPGVYDVTGDLRKPDVSIGDLAYVTAHGQYHVYKNSAHEYDITAASVLDILAIMKNLETLEIQPLGSLIEIEKEEISDTCEGGIEMIDTRKSPTNIGIVKSVGIGWSGPSGIPIPMQVSKGDRVIYNPLRLMVVDFSGLGSEEKRYLIHHGDIIGIINE